MTKKTVVSKKTARKPISSARKSAHYTCPVPRCRGKAAPVFGMVCSKHKDVKKSTIAKYRDARRKKLGIRAPRTA